MRRSLFSVLTLCAVMSCVIACAQFPPPFVRNPLDTNGPVEMTNIVVAIAGSNSSSFNTNAFVRSAAGAATNLNLWSRENFWESGGQRWGAQWFDNRFDLTNTGLGGVYSFNSAGYLTAGGFNGDGGGLTNLPGTSSSFATTNTAFASAFLKTDANSNYWSVNASGLTNLFWMDVNANNKSLTNLSKVVANSTAVFNGSVVVGNVNGIHLTNNSVNGNIITLDGFNGDGVLQSINDSVPLGTSKQPGLMITGTNSASSGAEALLLAAGSVEGIRFGAAVQYPLNVYGANHTNTILDSIVVITPSSANITNFLPANAISGTVFTCIKDPTFVSTNGVWIHAQARTIYPAAVNSLLTTNVGGGWQVVFASGAWYLLHNIP